jgi:AbrB family looped-hinge helix DNA binding protein
MYARLSKKGQITIPKVIREKLNIDSEGGVLFLVEDDEVKLKGIPGGEIDKLAGSFEKYAKTYVPLEKVKARIKGKIADAAAREGLSD